MGLEGGEEPPPGGLRRRSPRTNCFLRSTFCRSCLLVLTMSFVCTCDHVVFRSEKKLRSLDAGKSGFANNGDADMRIVTHDHTPLLEDYDYGHKFFIIEN